MRDRKNSAVPTSDELSVDTILQAMLGDKDAIGAVLKTFEPYIVEQSTVRHRYVDEDLTQMLRETLMNKIPDFRFKADKSRPKPCQLGGFKL